MRQDSKRLALLVVLLVVAFSLRLAAGFWWQAGLVDERSFGWADSHTYWTLAQNVVRGEPYAYGAEMRVFRTPGYPLLLAGLFALVGDDPPVMWARALGAVLGTLAVGGVVCLARQLFDWRTALLAGVMAAFYPGAIGMSTFVLSEAPFCPLMLAQLSCWTAASRATSPVRSTILAGVGGLAAGGATLVRPSWLLFTPLAVAITIITCRGRSRHLWQGLAMTAVLSLTMLPWWIRNYQISGRFVPTTLQVGASLYDGLHPQATGASDMSFVPRFYREQKQADAACTTPPVGTFESRLDQRMRQAAVSWARENPGSAIRLAGQKLRRIWSPWPSASQMQSWSFRLAILLGYTPLILLGVWGATKYWSRGWPFQLCVAPAVYFTALHVVFVSSIRYRQPAMLPLIVLAAGVLVGLTWRNGSTERRRPRQGPLDLDNERKDAE